MKVSIFAIILMLTSVLSISGCAYVQGVRDQKAATVSPVKQETSNGKEIPIEESAVPAPAEDTSPNPSSTAAKMIAPLTQ